MEEINTLSYSQARIRKDPNFDGRFFFAVRTTGIFCRPSCPSPEAKEANVEYYPTMFDAMEAGYRPCHRCRPELNWEYHGSYIPGADKVEEALQLIYKGFLNYRSLEELAAELCLSSRQLRKLFTRAIGIPPVKMARYHKAVFAKKLLTASGGAVTDIAFASGFRSIRQFNETYRDIFGEAPSDTRKKAGSSPRSGTRLLLKYRGTLDFPRMLSFLEPRLIRGVEAVREGRYFRSFRTDRARGWFSLENRPEEQALGLTVSCDDIRCYMELYYRARLMFDLDTDFAPIRRVLKADPLLRRGMPGEEAPRLPVAFEPFEFAVRAVLGQQISVKGATTLAARIAEQAGPPCGEGFPEGVERYFPTPREMAGLSLEAVGLPRARQETLREMTRAVCEGRLTFSKNQALEAFEESFTALKGIGPWTAHYVAMRGLGMKDAFPASDLGILKALAAKGRRPSPKQAEARGEAWRPYRSYGVLCLWNLPEGGE